MPQGTDRNGPLGELWEILTRAAADRRTITYGELAERLSGPSAKYTAIGMGRWLDPIAYYCGQRGWPRITDLVVSKARRVPGYKATAAQDFAADLERIYAHDWRRASVTPRALADAADAVRTSKRQTTVSAPSPLPAATPPPATTPPPTRPALSALRSGADPATVGGTIANHTLAITLHTVEDPLPRENWRNRPTAGTRRVRCDVSIHNKGGAPLNHSAAFFKLKTADNREYGDAMTFTQNMIGGGVVHPGDTLRGYLVFDVPTEGQIVRLSYNDSTNFGAFDLRQDQGPWWPNLST